MWKNMRMYPNRIDVRTNDPSDTITLVRTAHDMYVFIALPYGKPRNKPRCICDCRRTTLMECALSKS